MCIADVNTNVGQETAERFCSEYGKESAFFMECDVRNESNFEGTKRIMRIFTVSVSKLSYEVYKCWQHLDLNFKEQYFLNLGKPTYRELFLAVHSTHAHIHRPQTKLREGHFLHVSVILFTGGSAFPQCHEAGRTPLPTR